jgi:hypothetical protein
MRAIENQKLISSVEYKGVKHQQVNHTNQFNEITHHMPLNQNSGVINTAMNSVSVNVASFAEAHHNQPIVNKTVQRQVGSIADYDPLNFENQNFINRQMPATYSTGNLSQHQRQQVIQQQKSNSYNSTSSIPAHFSNQFASNQQHYKSVNQTARDDYSDDFMNSMARLNSDIKTSVYKAIYDYDGKDDDELSFRDGDKFINCEQIDVGWMIGVHEKTGKHGMFPSNYAEPMDYF